uniref:Uncharacterized protein n=1 Tax=Meloidogyne javanica TaxID=6303 RepID=A0A915M0D5_MELJA
MSSTKAFIVRFGPVQKNSKDNKLKSSKEKGKESKTKSKKKKEETKPVLKNESHDQKGMGAGDDYQTLGNLDRNIFIKGGSKDGGSPTPPAGGQQPVLKEEKHDAGIGGGADYQTLDNLDRNIFVKNSKNETPASPLAAPKPKDERANQQGVGDGDDYQTLGNLDKNIFVKRSDVPGEENEI